ncbi:hypothetical protein [Bartonella vinsonii]|uniref:hypothetical protein n=1 Tax=Bartonella vinsonii TaxID=33047 RepID=UPI000F82A292|nr:hypothetical protein [Bartonella vinsonii]
MDFYPFMGKMRCGKSRLWGIRVLYFLKNTLSFAAFVCCCSLRSDSFTMILLGCRWDVAGITRVVGIWPAGLRMHVPL